MELFTAMKERRSCRQFLPDPIDEVFIQQIIEAATWAPSPLNTQPWEFIVITQGETKEKLFNEAHRCRDWALEVSGWKWLAKYDVEFLKSVPVMIAVVGNPKKAGVDQFQEEGNVGYQHACAAAVQNMLLAAHALGLGGLWFTFFDKQALRDILDLGSKTPLALVCLGRTAEPPPAPPRKDMEKVTRFIR